MYYTHFKGKTFSFCFIFLYWSFTTRKLCNKTVPIYYGFHMLQCFSDLLTRTGFHWFYPCSNCFNTRINAHFQTKFVNPFVFFSWKLFSATKYHFYLDSELPFVFKLACELNFAILEFRLKWIANGSYAAKLPKIFVTFDSGLHHYLVYVQLHFDEIFRKLVEPSNEQLWTLDQQFHFQLKCVE